MEKSFYLLKAEAYLLGKEAFIRERFLESGLQIFANWRVRLMPADVLAMYPHTPARLTILARLPFLFETDVYWVRGEEAVARVDVLKHQIRDEIWGRRFRKGGFLHAPDSPEELVEHREILWSRLLQRRGDRRRLIPGGW